MSFIEKDGTSSHYLRPYFYSRFEIGITYAALIKGPDRSMSERPSTQKAHNDG